MKRTDLFMTKYKDIFTYFDALLEDFTATPKDEIDKNTYEVFELANGDPTYGYDLAQAVKDGYLVDYLPQNPGNLLIRVYMMNFQKQIKKSMKILLKTKMESFRKR